MWRDGRKVKDKRIEVVIKVMEEEEGRRGGDGFNTSVVCFSGPAGKRGTETFKTLHPHELDRPLENTRATF